MAVISEELLEKAPSFLKDSFNLAKEKFESIEEDLQGLIGKINSYKDSSQQELINRVTDLTEKVKATQEELESKISENFKKAIEKLEIPTREQLVSISERLDKLDKKVDEVSKKLTKLTKTAKPAAAKKTTAKK